MILNQKERIDHLEIIQTTPYSNHSCGKHTTMDDNGGSNKVTGIRQIVRLKGFLQKWQHVTIGSKANTSSASSSSQPNGGISPAISRRLKGYNVYSDSDAEDGCQSPEPPHGVPKGYLAVYVGSELRRFIIPTSYLSDPLFKVLLEKVEEEFGFDHRGGLTIPCEIETFKYLLKCMENHQKDHVDENEGLMTGLEKGKTSLVPTGKANAQSNGGIEKLRTPSPPGLAKGWTPWHNCSNGSGKNV